MSSFDKYKKKNPSTNTQMSAIERYKQNEIKRQQNSVLNKQSVSSSDASQYESYLKKYEDPLVTQYKKAQNSNSTGNRFLDNFNQKIERVKLNQMANSLVEAERNRQLQEAEKDKKEAWEKYKKEHPIRATVGKTAVDLINGLREGVLDSGSSLAYVVGGVNSAANQFLDSDVASDNSEWWSGLGKYLENKSASVRTESQSMLGNSPNKNSAGNFIGSTIGQNIDNILPYSIPVVGQGLGRTYTILESLGRAYGEAINSGVDETTALKYALIEGGAEGAIENMGGFENILKGKLGKTTIGTLINTGLGEGTEEVLQGIVHRYLDDTLSQENVGEFFSTSDDKAIINPKTAFKEFTGGFAGGVVLGGGASILNGSLSNDIKKATSKVKNAFKKSSELEKESGYFSKNDKGENVLNAATPDGTVTSDSIDNVTFDSTEQADMYKYASTLDTATANRFLQNYKENYSHATPKLYTDGYRAYYEHGVSQLYADKDFDITKTMEKIESIPSLKSVAAESIGMKLTDKAAAYMAGYNKAQAKLQADLKAVPTFTAEQIKNAEFGVINRKDDAFKNMSKEMRTVVSAIAKTQKVKVAVVDNITSNGFYDRDNEIVYLNSKSQNPASYLLGHEMTHRNAYISPAEHKEFSDYTLNVLKKKDLATFNKIFNETKKLYETALNKTLDESYINEEIVANSTAELFNDADFVEGLVKQNRSLAQKILDFIKDLIGKITGKGFKITENYTIKEAEMLSEVDAKDLQEIRRLFEKALAKTKERVTTATETDTEAQKNTDSKAEGEIKFSINPNFVKEYDAWDKQSVRHFYIGKTSSALSSVGVSNKKIFWDGSKIKKIQDKHPAMTDNIIKQVPDILENPVLIMESKTVDGRLTLFGEIYDQNNNPVLAVLELNPNDKNGNSLNVIKIASAYGKDTNPQALIDKSNILYVNKNRAEEWLRKNRLQLPIFNQSGSTNSIPDNSGNVNTSDKRFSLPQNAEENKAYSKLVEKHFGTTYNWNETGYLLRNGKKLDFSGKNNGAPRGYRSIDHRDINEAFFDVETFIDEGRFTEEDLPNEELVSYLSDLSGTEAMVDFMQRGNIRIMPETGGINLSVEPTSSQYDSLSDFISRNRGEVILDIDGAKGNTIASVEYSRGTHANRVINDIKNYFANGTIPSVSVVSDFHTRYSLPNDYSYKALTNKPDMKVNYVGNVSVPKAEGRVDRGAVISKSIENIRKYSNKKNTENKVFLFNKDLNRDVKITKESIAHGLRRKSENNAIASLVLGEYFTDAICVNELSPRENTNGSYVLLGTFNDNSNDFYVRMVVNNKNNVFEVDDINVLYALNTKKEPVANSRLGLGVETDSLITGSTISIADFLENVKKHFPEVLSEDVLNHFNITRPSNAFNNDLLFSLSPDQIAEVGDLNDFEEVLGLESDVTESLTEDFNKLVKITKGKTVDKQTVRKTARNFVTRTMTGNYYKGQKFDELVDRLYNVFNYLAESDSVDLGQVSYIMKNIAGDLISHSESKIDLTDEQEAVKKAIREKRIYVPEHIRNGGDFDNYGGFEKFRRLHFGKLRIVNNPEGATSWDELYETFNEEVGYPIFDKSDSDLTGNSAASVLERLADVYKSLQPAYINPYEDGVLALTNEEQTGLLGWEMLESYFEIAGDVKTEAVADSFKKKIEKIKADNKVKREELEKKFKAKYTEGKKAIRDRMKESANKKKYRQRINKDIRDLNNMLLKPTEKKHVPIPLEKPLAEFLKSIDTSSERLNKYGEPTERTLVWRNLCDFYEQVINGSVEECSSIKFDADMLAEFKELIKRTQAVKLDELNATELKGLSEFIKSIKHSIRNIDKAFSMKKNEEIGALASDFQLYLSENQYFKYKNEKNDFSKSVERFVKYDQLNAVSFFHTLGPVGEKFYSSLQDARDKRAVNIEKARNYAKEVLKEIDIKSIQGKNAKTFVFDVEGQELRLTTGDIMTIRGLYKRHQAKRHITNGGITLKLQKTKEVQEGKKLKKKVYFKQYDALNLNVNVLSEMFSKLTAEEIKVADKLQNFLSQECSEWGNEVSENLYGYKKYTEPNYFPIETNKDFIHSKEGGQGNSLENILEHSSFTKATVINAANPLVIRNFMDVWVDHVERIASYNAYVPVLTDMNRFINHSSSTHFVGDDGETIRTNYKSIKTSMKKAYGVTDNGERSNAEDYWHNLVLDINGAGRNDNSTPSKLLAFLNSNAKVASIGLNPRVVIQQPTAILRAGTEIEPIYLLKALTKGHGKAEVNRMLEICPIAMIKMYGGSDINTGKTTSEILLDNQSTYSKIKEKSMYFAGKADEVAWVHLFKAVELKVQKTHPEYEVDSAEYKQAVNEMFRNIIDKTQVVDSVLNRSKLMRSKNEMVKASTNFMSEPTVMYNMMYRAGFDAKIHKKGAFKNGGRTIGFILVSVIANAFAKSLVDALRDDDDEKSYGEKYVNALIGDYSDKEKGFMKEFILKSNIGGELNVFNWIPFIKDAFSIAQGYDNERLEMSGYSDVVSSVMRTIEYCYDAHKGEANKLTSGAVIVQLAKGMSKATGLPISNVIREITSLDDDLIYAFKENGMNSPELEYNLKSLAYQKNKANSSMYSKIAIEARSNGDITFMNHIRNDLIEGGMKPSEIKESFKSAATSILKEDKTMEALYKAVKNHDYDEAEKYEKELLGRHFTEEEIKSALTYFKNKAKEDKEEPEEVDTGKYESKPSSIYTYEDMAYAFLNGDKSYEDIRADLIEVSSAKDPEGTVNSQLKSELRQIYKDSFHTNEDLRKKTWRALKKLGYTDEDIIAITKNK